MTHRITLPSLIALLLAAYRQDTASKPARRRMADDCAAAALQ